MSYISLKSTFSYLRFNFNEFAAPNATAAAATVVGGTSLYTTGTGLRFVGKGVAANENEICELKLEFPILWQSEIDFRQSIVNLSKVGSNLY